MKKRQTFMEKVRRVDELHAKQYTRDGWTDEERGEFMALTAAIMIKLIVLDEMDD